MLRRLSLAVHRLLSPFCSIFPINKVPGETLARWVLGLSCRKLPPFSVSFLLSTWSHLQLLILSLLLLTLPSRASSLSSVSSLPFGLFLRCGSALPLPQPATSSLPLQTFFCFSPPYFSCHSPPGFHRSKPIGSSLTVQERCSHVLSRSCSSRCPRWGQDFARAVLRGPSPCPQLPSTKPSFYLPLPSPSPGSLQRTAPEFARKRCRASPRQLWSLVPPKTELIQPPKSPTGPDHEL